MTILDSSLHIAALGQSSAVVLRSFQLSDRSQDIGPHYVATDSEIDPLSNPSLDSWSMVWWGIPIDK